MAGDPLAAILLQMWKYCSASNGTPDRENQTEVRRRRDMTKQRKRLACMEIPICVVPLAEGSGLNGSSAIRISNFFSLPTVNRMAAIKLLMILQCNYMIASCYAQVSFEIFVAGRSPISVGPEASDSTASTLDAKQHAKEFETDWVSLRHKSAWTDWTNKIQVLCQGLKKWNGWRTQTGKTTSVEVCAEVLAPSYCLSLPYAHTP